MTTPVAVLELAFAPLTAGIFKILTVKPIPPYPSVSRDMAIIVNESVNNEDILNIVRKYAPSELTAVELFDIYASEAIGAGKKSLACSLTYRASTRTLTDEEANGLHSAVKAAIVKELNAEVRER
jgi:phenylalanyl-tRNA synthetase beta chain